MIILLSDSEFTERSGLLLCGIPVKVTGQKLQPGQLCTAVAEPIRTNII